MSTLLCESPGESRHRLLSCRGGVQSGLLLICTSQALNSGGQESQQAGTSILAFLRPCMSSETASLGARRPALTRSSRAQENQTRPLAPTPAGEANWGGLIHSVLSLFSFCLRWGMR